MIAMTRTFRGAPSLEGVHIALCTWAEESRGGLPARAAPLTDRSAFARSVDFSNQSAAVDRILIEGPPPTRIFLDSYYRRERPRSVICRIMRISDRTFDYRMLTYRQFVGQELRARGFRV